MSHRWRRIDSVDQLAETSESAAEWREDQPGQLRSVELILFFRKRSALDNFATSHDVRELCIEIRNRFRRQAAIQADDIAFAYPACRMINLVKIGDLRGGGTRAVLDLEKREVFL